jgi:hypothetical protein
MIFIGYLRGSAILLRMGELVLLYDGFGALATAEGEAA